MFPQCTYIKPNGRQCKLHGKNAICHRHLHFMLSECKFENNQLKEENEYLKSQLVAFHKIIAFESLRKTIHEYAGTNYRDIDRFLCSDHPKLQELFTGVPIDEYHQLRIERNNLCHYQLDN